MPLLFGWPYRWSGLKLSLENVCGNEQTLSDEKQLHLNILITLKSIGDKDFLGFVQRFLHHLRWGVPWWSGHQEQFWQTKRVHHSPYLQDLMSKCFRSLPRESTWRVLPNDYRFGVFRQTACKSFQIRVVFDYVGTFCSWKVQGFWGF